MSKKLIAAVSAAASSVVIEPLETRSMMSASPTITADLAAMAAAKVQLRVDITAGVAKVRADKTQLIADRKGVGGSQAAALQVQLQTDVADARKLLASGKTSELTALAADAKAVGLDVVAVVKAGTDPVALAAAEVQLATDKAKLLADRTSLTGAFTADVLATANLIVKDRAAIAAAAADTSLTVVADRQKLVADAEASAATVAADHTALVSAYQKLAADRAAKA